MSALIEALNDLTETLREDGFSDNIVANIARDYEVSPVLLERNFTARTGKAPADFKAKTFAELRAAAVERAHNLAIENAAEYTGGPDVAGKSFMDKEGDEMIAVVVSTRGVIAIRVRDGRRFKYGTGKAAFATAEKFGIL